ncbi:MAG: type II toxin-antitoxin system MqsA family antitoxin [Phormidium sp. GEM2.Bin31]|nr:type II toxin-antitoxin system MqsA family antitoxin [Phormidium sp. BM_Day4_Bin.17]TVR06413.1 MAG: type II toxin-antitoxin system MqsA family antitoxin [Phormidium sp. GEM2.Bin31]UCJ12247.1 MAG: type II toxin-antitoxin system MqsA family antitoxin [Phormidium sp. PBR-2020]
MNCVICKHGQTVPGRTTVTLDRDGVIVILKNVPAEICDTCGEYYLSEETTRVILESAEQAIAKGIDLEVRQYAAC